ncbi:MAG: restriction endonuclease subunit S [Campylobacter sp.]|uniref:restriction endonuclease subunit S n=1 Tax=Campylobacter sp. TaxID=205 RepID=UPI002A831D13|nr:restriction endonuclease subunit S [Campylobacter sp.]MCI7587054.1 restriction endonuclease subunit S [Campylobacter sp.]MDY5115219.1 restriction endonuclease subunit S [Campylobacter sp.]
MIRAMKDSGIEWIGEIPKDWKLPKVKQLFSIGRGRVISQLDLEDTGYPVYSSQTKNNGCLGYISTYDFDRSQLTWTTDGANAGTVFLREGKHNCTNVCGTLTSKNDENSLLYLKYALEYIVIYHKRADINGFKIMNNEMAEIKVTLPSMPEQQKIADFLDEKCSHIDSVLEKVRASIDEYKQLKQSVITQAVTKGIRPNRPMKDSGIEWIGEIPQDWEIRKIKSLGQYRNGLTYAPEDMCEESNGTLVLRSSNVKQGKISYDDNIYVSTTIPKQLYVRKGDILVCSRNGSRELIGKNAIIKDNIVASFGAFMMIYRCDTPEYVYYILNSHVFNYYLGSFLTSTINQLTGKNFGNMSVVYCPNKTEQTEIASYLDDKCSKIDKLITKKEQLIAELETYKKSLIYEYVTGKKEVK